MPIPRDRQGQSNAVFDVGVALQYVSGDSALLREVIGICLEEFAENMPLIRQAIQKGDCATVGDVVHVMKAQLGTVGAKPAAGAARELERAAHSGDVLRAKQWSEALEAELARLVPLLTALRSQSSPHAVLESES